MRTRAFWRDARGQPAAFAAAPAAEARAAVVAGVVVAVAVAAALPQKPQMCSSGLGARKPPDWSSS